MSRRQNIREKGFVLETGGRALLAFKAGGIEQAKRLCAKDWFIEELASYRSSGHPIWDGSTELKIRRANAAEAAEVQIALTGELARREYQGYVFVFFVPVDAELQ
jgi:hypothetical protein